MQASSPITKDLPFNSVSPQLLHSLSTTLEQLTKRFQRGAHAPRSAQDQRSQSRPTKQTLVQNSGRPYGATAYDSIRSFRTGVH